jgi:lipoprotein NlpD
MKNLLPVLTISLGLLACGGQQPVADPQPDPAPVVYDPQIPPPAGMLVDANTGTAPPLKGVWYTVKRGDFISAIASRHGVPTEDLVEINGLAHPEKLEVGQKLFLVNAGRARAPKPRRRSTARQEKPRSTGGDRRVTTRRRNAPFIWPVRTGELVSYFGKRGNRMHKGIDIKAPERTKIYAIADGQVIFSDEQRGYGNLIIIRHDKNMVSVYAHNRVNRVDEGERIRQGQEIAEVGKTGATKVPHLHFELRYKGKAQNPLVRLPATNNLNR